MKQSSESKIHLKCMNRVSALSCLIGVFVHGVEHDLSSFTEVLYSLHACMNLPQVHVLTVALIWTELHRLQIHAHRCQGP